MKDPEHGTVNKYDSGCRCPLCREAKTESLRQWKAKYKAEHGVEYYARPGRKRTTWARECAFCGQAFTTRTHSAKYCSAICGSHTGAGWSNSKAVMRWQHPYKQWAQNIPVTVLPNTWTYTSGECEICGKGFVSKHRDVTCSDECAQEKARDRRRARDARRRARELSAYREKVVSRKVFERDGYKCHICGKATKRNARVPDHKAPTLDHIIPLNAGGTHEMSNVATAHFLCNSLKSDKGTGDQLLLFG